MVCRRKLLVRGYRQNPFFVSIDEKGNSHRLNGRYYYTGNDNRPYRSENVDDQDNFSHLIYGEYQYQKRFNQLQKIGLVLTTGAVASKTISIAALFGDGDQLTLNARNIGLYGQADFKFFDKLNLSAGARLESNLISFSEAETKPVFRVGLNYQAAKYTYIRASWGQGYRFPTIAEKFIKTEVGSIVIGQNLDLVSETGMSAEVGIKQGVKLGRDINALIDVSGFLF